MLNTGNKFDWNSLRNLFLGLVFSIIILPLILLLFFASKYKEPTQTTNSSSTKLASDIPNTPIPQSSPPPAKIVLVNPTTNKPTYSAEEETTSPPPTSNPPASSPPTSSPPAPTQPSSLEFTGTVTAISAEIITFNYGNNQSVAVTLAKSSPNSFHIGTRAHVHAKLKNGIYVEDEIEIL